MLLTININDKGRTMEKIKILIVGRDPVVIQKLLRFVNENLEWEGTGTVDDRSAITLFGQIKFDYAVLVDYISEASIEMFHQQFKTLNPEVVFLRHYGDSTGLLASELFDLMDGYPVKLEIEEA